MIRALAILVPVHNEEELLPRFIDSLRTALTEVNQARQEVGTAVVFALDRCTDRSEEFIQEAGFLTIRSESAGVGAARMTAADAVMGGYRTAEFDQLWLANTDSDSAVPWNWLIHQLDLADAGADVVIGSVRPDLSDLDEARRIAWETTHNNGQALGHVHGANLGIRASTYNQAGGLEPVTEHEDVDLVERAMVDGAAVVASDSHTVTTSGRLVGRTGGGYAGYLREQLLPLAQGTAEDQQKSWAADISS